MLAAGVVQIRSNVTLESGELAFIVLNLGDHNILTGLDAAASPAWFDRLKAEQWESFTTSDMTGCIHALEERFGGRTWSLWHIFKDEQRKILQQILSVPLAELESAFRQFREHHSPLIQALKQRRLALPPAFDMTAAFVINADLLALLATGRPDLDKLQHCVEDARRLAVKLEEKELGFAAAACVVAGLSRLEVNPDSLAALEALVALFRILAPLGLDISLGSAQNRYFLIGKQQLDRVKAAAGRGDERAGKWFDLFGTLGRFLNVRVI
jgi:hypothetical protein